MAYHPSSTCPGVRTIFKEYLAVHHCRHIALRTLNNAPALGGEIPYELKLPNLEVVEIDHVNVSLLSWQQGAAVVKAKVGRQVVGEFVHGALERYSWTSGPVTHPMSKYGGNRRCITQREAVGAAIANTKHR